jgi:hypothetical protein
MIRNTYTFAVLDLSSGAFEEISRKLKDAGYEHAFSKSDGRVVIDMQGIAVACEPLPPLPGAHEQIPSSRDQAIRLFNRYGGVQVDHRYKCSPSAQQLNAALWRMKENGVPETVAARAAELVTGDPA